MALHPILTHIRQIRKEKGLSQTAMADRLYMSLKTYQNIENGVTRMDIDRLQQIAVVLDIDPASLFGMAEQPAVLGEQEHSLLNGEKALYHKIISDKETYIAQLEEHIRFYQELLKENKFP